MVSRQRRHQAGFTFVGLLFAVAIAGVALAGTGALWQLEGQREREKELLFCGEEYRHALERYYARTPGDAKQYPEQLDDLLQDKRFPMPVRHLRRLYREPLGDDGAWQLIRQQGRIIGVASRSHAQPIKIAGFAAGQEEFEGAASYGDWKFVARGDNASGAAAAPAKP